MSTSWTSKSKNVERLNKAWEGLNRPSDYNFVQRAFRNAKPRSGKPQPRWVVIGDTFSLGAEFAVAMCREFGFDPYEVLGF